MIYVAEITAAVDSIGTLQTFYVCMGRGFTTRPTDTPANTVVDPYLSNPGNYRRELFSGARTFGAVRPSFGEVVIQNSRGQYDAWRTYGFDGQRYVLRAGEEGAAYPAGFTTVFQCTMVAPTMTENEIRIRLKDRLDYLNKPILNQSLAGTGGVEGSSDMAGEAKPRCFADPVFFPLKLVDPASRIYLAHCETAGGLAGAINVYEGGVLMTRGADYATVADMIATAPSAGQVRVYPHGPVYIRTGSVPAFDLRIISYGYQPGTGSSFNFGLLAEEAGVTGTINAFTGIQSTYVDDAGTTYMDVMSESAKHLMAWFGFNRLDEFESGTFAAPTGTALFEFSHRNCAKITRSPPAGSEVPVYRLTANTGKTWPCQCAGATPADIRDKLTRTPWYAKFTYSNGAVLAKHALADSVNVELQSRFQNATEWNAFRDKYFDLFGVDRDQFTLECILTDELIALDLNDVVSLAMPRFGLDAGKLFRIVAIELNMKSNRVNFTLWG